MDLEFAAEIIEWRGPAPFYFVPLKVAVRRAEALEEGDTVSVRLVLDA
jgi:hypothetical protein